MLLLLLLRRILQHGFFKLCSRCWIKLLQLLLLLLLVVVVISHGRFSRLYACCWIMALLLLLLPLLLQCATMCLL
jgi:hypothetical protein